MLGNLIVIGIILLTGLTGCRTVHLADEISFYGLKTDVEAGEQTGIVEGYNCGLRVLGFGPGAKLTKAFDMLRDDQDLRYLTRMKVYRRYRNWLFVDRDCWIVRGIGYK